jgi:hypothetical protein
MGWFGSYSSSSYHRYSRSHLSIEHNRIFRSFTIDIYDTTTNMSTGWLMLASWARCAIKCCQACRRSMLMPRSGECGWLFRDQPRGCGLFLTLGHSLTVLGISSFARRLWGDRSRIVRPTRAYWWSPNRKAEAQHIFKLALKLNLKVLINLELKPSENLFV